MDVHEKSNLCVGIFFASTKNLIFLSLIESAVDGDLCHLESIH